MCGHHTYHMLNSSGLSYKVSGPLCFYSMRIHFSYRADHVQICIYMAKVMRQKDLKQLVLRQFGIRITSHLSIVPLQRTEWLLASKWPRFTLLGQTAAAALVGYLAARSFVPEV